VRTGDTGAAQDRDPLAGVQDVSRPSQRRVVGTQHRTGRQHRSEIPRILAEPAQKHLAGNHHDRNPTLLHRGAHRDFDDARRHLGVADQFAIDAAFPEQFLGMGFLKVARADLSERNVRGDRQHRNAGALRVVEPVDQVQIPGPAAAHAYRKLTGQRRVGGRGERGGLLMADGFPGDGIRAADRVGETVEAVARHPIDPSDSADRQGADDVLGDGYHGFGR